MKSENSPKRFYEVVLIFTLDNEQEVYAHFDIELYCTLRKKIGFQKFLFDKHQNGFGVTPISVEAAIYLDPKIMFVPTPMGEEMVCVGKKIFSLDFFQ